MTKKLLLEEIEELIGDLEIGKKIRHNLRAAYEKKHREEIKQDNADLYDIYADYYSDLEYASLRALEQLTALKDRIEGRGE